MIILSERRDTVKNQTDETTPLKKKRKSTEVRKLTRAVTTLASIIDGMATTMKEGLEVEGACDVKQLKELCSTAKELSALMNALEDRKTDERSAHLNALTVLFEGEGEEWAK